MRKVYLQCEICGQKMKVSRSAIGKKGACPRCGLTIRITTENSSPFPPSRWNTAPGSNAEDGVFNRYADDNMGLPGPSEEAKQRFALGVDLFCNSRYEEALAVFNALARIYPGNPDIDSAREQCMKAMRRAPITLPGPKDIPRGSVSGNGAATATAQPEDLDAVRTAMLNKLLDKMQQGATDAIQLQAVELLLKLLPSMEKQQAGSATADNEERYAQDAQEPSAKDKPRTSHQKGKKKRGPSHKRKERAVDARESSALKHSEGSVEDADDGKVVHAYAEIMEHREAADEEAKKQG